MKIPLDANCEAEITLTDKGWRVTLRDLDFTPETPEQSNVYGVKFFPTKKAAQEFILKCEPAQKTLLF